jgi:hypothetical protein
MRAMTVASMGNPSRSMAQAISEIATAASSR